jgi:hypothetical protein
MSRVQKVCRTVGSVSKLIGEKYLVALGQIADLLTLELQSDHFGSSYPIPHENLQCRMCPCTQLPAIIVSIEVIFICFRGKNKSYQHGANHDEHLNDI